MAIQGVLRFAGSGRALAAGFLALSLFIAAAVTFSLQQQSSDAVVRRALGIEISLADVFSTLQDAEIGQRGFLLTGDESFLDPYRRTADRLARQLSALDSAAVGDDALVASLTRLRTLAASKQDELAKTLALHRAGQSGEALALVRSGEGKRTMDEIRALTDMLDAHEDEVVSRRQGNLRLIRLLTTVSTLVAVVLLGVVALAAMREVRRRAELSRFLPAEVAPRLAAGDPSLRDGHEVNAAVVFVDIRGSTGLATRLPIPDFAALLSGFRTDIMTAARSHNGLVDKFIGDGALIVFGAHDATTAAAGEAVAFARDLLDRSHARHGSTYRIGIGVHYGPVLCGIFGAAERREFSVLGDTVNVAARIEEECKALGAELLVSDAALTASGEASHLWHGLGGVVLRGREGMTALFTLAPLAKVPA